MTSSRQWQYGSLPPCVVIGSSRGLGAALVTALFRAGATAVLGVSRTSTENIPQLADWRNQGYLHLEVDIGAKGAMHMLEQQVRELPSGPLLVIFNAACIENDVLADSTLDLEIFARINRVAITGFANTVQALQPRLLADGGMLVGISSINAIKPSVMDRSVAYPATKAYLAMSLRSLSVLWRQRVTVSVIHLGHVGGADPGSFWGRLVNPSYRNTAEWLIRAMLAERLPAETTYPPLYRFFYQYLLRSLPDRGYVFVLKHLLQRIVLLRQLLEPDKK